MAKSKAKKLTKSQLKFWQDYLNASLKVFNMSHWTLDLSPDLSKEDWACVDRWTLQKRADLTFGLLFINATPEDQAQTVAHEIAHLVTDELVDSLHALKDSMKTEAFNAHEIHVSNAEERTVDQMASFMKRLLPLPLNAPKRSKKS